MTENQPKFIVDTMCGRLSRWLRILGYDTRWVSNRERRSLIVQSLKECRILVTRDHRYEKMRGIKKILIHSDRLSEQIHELSQAFHLSYEKARFFQRCTFCNTKIVEIPKEDAYMKVPHYVYITQKHFFSCTECSRIYWGGTHSLLFIKQLEKITGLNFQ